VTLLRRVLRWQAVLWAGFGLVLAVAPGWLVEVLLDQPSLGEDAWLRAAGVMAVALAAQMVLVGHRVDDLWWWSWTFMFLEVATGLVFLLNALVGLPDGAVAWPWWGLGSLNLGFAALELAALAKAGTESSAV
jgi:hypothetical protein